MTDSSCILVCVTVQKDCERLIRRGHQESQNHNLPLQVVHVNTGKAILGNPDTAEALNHLYALSREFDAEMSILQGSNVIETLVSHAKQQGARMIIMGTDRSGIVHTLSLLLPECQIIACNPA